MPADSHAPRHADRPEPLAARAVNCVLASMIDAEVNEGGPPSAVPCDTPSENAPTAAGPSARTATVDVRSAPGGVIHLPLGPALANAATSTLLCTPGLRLVRLPVPAGKVIPPHRAPGEIVVQCVEGRVTLRCHETRFQLAAGDVLHLDAGAVHSLAGVEDASVLLTLLLPTVGGLAGTTVAV